MTTIGRQAVPPDFRASIQNLIEGNRALPGEPAMVIVLAGKDMLHLFTNQRIENAARLLGTALVATMGEPEKVTHIDTPEKPQ